MLDSMLFLRHNIYLIDYAAFDRVSPPHLIENLHISKPVWNIIYECTWCTCMKIYSLKIYWTVAIIVYVFIFWYSFTEMDQSYMY